MSANVNTTEEGFLDEMLLKLDTSFGSRRVKLKKFIDGVKYSISSLKNVLAYEKVEEVAALVRQGEPHEVVQQKLHCNFPDDSVDVGKVEEMLKLVYVGADCTENLKKAINFVQVFDPKHHAAAYKSIYDDVKFKNHTKKPEMLLLQKRIEQLKEDPEEVVASTRFSVSADCARIILSIVIGITKKDYSLSRYIAESIDSELLNEKMFLMIVNKFSTSLEDTLLLIEYARLGLPFIENISILIDVLLKKLEKHNLLRSEQAMHLWALAIATAENPNLALASSKAQQLCTEAVHKLSPNKLEYFKFYQKYLEREPKTIHDMHASNVDLLSIFVEFVPFYYDKSDMRRAHRLLAAAKAINEYDAAGHLLSQLHNQLAKHEQLNLFVAFKLFNEVKRYMGFQSYNTEVQPAIQNLFEKLKEDSLPYVRLLLWPESTCTEFQLVNKFFGAATLSIGDDQVCVASGADRRLHRNWRIVVDQDASLLTLTNAQNENQQLDFDESLQPCMSHTGMKWMVKAVDQNHFKIFFHCDTDQDELFLTADVTTNSKGHQQVCLRRENSTDMQQWYICTQ